MAARKEMSIFDTILEKNKETNGNLTILVGSLIIALSLLFTESYVPQLGFLGSLPYMYVEMVEGEYVPPIYETKPSNRKAIPGSTIPNIKVVKEGYYKGRIPTKYLLVVGLSLIGFGIYTRVTNKGSSKDA